MTNITFFLIFIPILATVLLLINFVLAPHLPDKNKDAQFECGFSSFTQMSRLPFSISFFIYALLFLLFDLEILLVYPYVVSAYNNSIYGLVVMLIFFILLTIGFVFELGKKALQIDSRQTDVYLYNNLISELAFKTYYIFFNLPNLFMRIYAKYPNITNFLLFFVIYLGILLSNCVILHCDSSPESIEDFKDKSIVVHRNSSNSEYNDNPNNDTTTTDTTNNTVTNINTDTATTDTNIDTTNTSTNTDTNTNVDSNANKSVKGKRVHWADPISTSNTDINVDIKGKGKAIFQESSSNDTENTDTRDTSKIPFTMDRSIKDFWENSYDDDDRRRHYTTLDRLGITAEQWEDDYFDRVGTIEVIKREMDILRAQEEEDKAIASKIVESLQDEDKAIAKQIAKSSESPEDSKKRKLEEFLQADEDIARKLQKFLYEADPSSKADPFNEVGPSSQAESSSQAGPSSEYDSYSQAESSSQAGPSNRVDSYQSGDSDSDSDYSVLSSIRGDESPNTYQKKLEVLEVEFNLKKK